MMANNGKLRPATQPRFSNFRNRRFDRAEAIKINARASELTSRLPQTPGIPRDDPGNGEVQSDNADA
jgi:hypothetical protein